MPKQEHLTNEFAESVELPEKGFVEIQDDEVKALRLRVSHTGRRSWHYYAWHDGPKRKKLGILPEMSATAARDKARRRELSYMTGNEDLLKPKRQPSPVLGTVWEQYIAAVEPRFRPKTMYEKHAVWENHLSQWRTRPIKSITRKQVMELHESIGKDHAVTANRVLKVLKAMINWAIDRGIVTENPCNRIQKFRETPRERFLRPDERKKFLAELAKANENLRHFVILAVSTGQRKSQILSMRWSDIDFSSALWTIPASTSETKNAYPIPLLPSALDVLQRRREKAKGKWVFPGRKDGTVGHLQDLKGSWKAMVARAGCADLTMHDLRRTLGSWMAIQGSSTAIIGRALSHQDQASTAIYARLTTDPVAAAMQTAVSGILEGIDKKAQKTDSAAD